MRTILPLTMVLAIAACGDEVSVSFGSLSGSYEVSENCFIHVAGSKGEASCNWTETDYSQQSERSGTLKFSLSESRITANLIATKRDRWCWDDECDPWTQCTYTIDASGDKVSGRSSEGQFSPLAGAWTGLVEIRETCFFEGIPEISSSLVTFSADIGGNAASISHTDLATSDQQAFAVTATDGGLEIDGDFVRKL